MAKAIIESKTRQESARRATVYMTKTAYNYPVAALLSAAAMDAGSVYFIDGDALALARKGWNYSK
jgi:hypothetical protein